MRGTVVGRVYVKYEKESGKLRMSGGSWSINLADINGKDFDSIKYVTEKSIYEISLEDAFRSGFERVFGGENKLIVPLIKWRVTNR
jgi:hypothetical protein